MFEKNENKQKEAGVGHLKNEKKHFKSSSKESFTEKNWKALDTEQNCYHPLGTFSCLFILPIHPYPSSLNVPNLSASAADSMMAYSRVTLAG